MVTEILCLVLQKKKTTTTTKKTNKKNKNKKTTHHMKSLKLHKHIITSCEITKCSLS